MSEPPQPSWQGNQPPDPNQPQPPYSGPPYSGPPASGPPSGGGYEPPAPPAPSYGQSDPYAAPPAPSYGQSDPYAAAPPPPAPDYGAQAGYPGQPPQPGFPGAPGQPFPGAVPPKKSNAGKIALIIGLVAVVLLCACGGLVAWGVNRAGDEINEAVDALPSILATPSDTPTISPTDDDRFDKGDCVVNEGTNSDPKLKKVPCKAGTFEVVAEVPFTTDTTRCDNEFLGAGKGKYDSTYSHDVSPGTLGDYVLCLKER